MRSRVRMAMLVCVQDTDGVLHIAKCAAAACSDLGAPPCVCRSSRESQCHCRFGPPALTSRPLSSLQTGCAPAAATCATAPRTARRRSGRPRGSCTAPSRRGVSGCDTKLQSLRLLCLGVGGSRGNCTAPWRRGMRRHSVRMPLLIGLHSAALRCQPRHSHSTSALALAGSCPLRTAWRRNTPSC